MNNTLILSLCIPAYQRPQWLERNLTSIQVRDNIDFSKIEIVITDDSNDYSCQHVAQSILCNYPGPWHYHKNPHRLGMVRNWNRSIELCQGDYVLVLHDDDYLLPHGLGKIIEILSTRPRHPLILFGVHLIRENESLIRIQAPRRQQFLSPQQAVQQLLNNSSFVRFPGLVIQRQLFLEHGYFSEAYGEATDIEMWLRLMSQVGLYCLPNCTAAYRIHTQALTMGMFTRKTIQVLREIFILARATHLLSPQDFNQAEANFLHQFILAGTVRFLKQRRWPEAQAVFQLFVSESMQGVQPSPKWWGLRRGLGLLFRFLKLLPP